MNRRSALILLSAGLLCATAARASGFVDDILAQLKGQGFETQRVEKTWLGRVRIVAHNPKGTREIIVNPNTGEILRDLWTPLQADDGSKPPLVRETGGNASGGGDDGSDDHHGGGGDDDGGDDHHGGDDD